MVHLYTHENVLQTLFLSNLTFFIMPYLLVMHTKVLNMNNSINKDPCMTAFILGFILSLIVWTLYIKQKVYS